MREHKNKHCLNIWCKILHSIVLVSNNKTILSWSCVISNQARQDSTSFVSNNKTRQSIGDQLPVPGAQYIPTLRQEHFYTGTVGWSLFDCLSKFFVHLIDKRWTKIRSNKNTMAQICACDSLMRNVETLYIYNFVSLSWNQNCLKMFIFTKNKLL